MATDSRPSYAEAKKRRDTLENLTHDVHDSCEVMTNYIKDNYDDENAATKLKELAGVLSGHFLLISKKVEVDSPTLGDEKVKGRLKNVSDSFQRHGVELESAVTGAGIGKEGIMLSVDACMVETRLLEKLLRSVDNGQILVEFVIKQLEDLVTRIGPVEKSELEKLKKEREEKKKEREEKKKEKKSKEDEDDDSDESDDDD